MADKRIYDLDSASFNVSDSWIVDRSGFTEAKEVSTQELIDYLVSKYTKSGSFAFADLGSNPNYDLNIIHNLDTSNPSITVFDGSGNSKQITAFVVDADTLKLRLRHPITGTWTYKISKI